jgi:hypothetical protein
MCNLNNLVKCILEISKSVQQCKHRSRKMKLNRETKEFQDQTLPRRLRYRVEDLIQTENHTRRDKS